MLQLKLLESEFVARLENMLAKFSKNESELGEKRREMKPVVDQLFVQAQMSLNQGEKLVGGSHGASKIRVCVLSPGDGVHRNEGGVV